MIEQHLLNGRLIVETGDITEKNVDAVVNAANSSLMGGGGVDGAIHRRGGPEIKAECKTIRQTSYPDGLPAGEAVHTTAGELPAKYVIHTVGPIWKDGQANESEILSNAYRNSLQQASTLKLGSIAFPAISTGIYGYPREKAARVAFDSINDFLEKNDIPEKVFLVFYSELDAQIFLDSIR
ncbi:MAG: O-acetyl-ADP-ribose deacetylase [Spirochaetales bacterium]|nr:O-acetyl-ADP-ribose deacetylase [Spirochaetales bacterium]